MAVRIESQAEPIPGYRLLERLGGGGFGEVWKCVAPGGLHKAIKFVFGDLKSAGDNGHRAEQELKALNRVKTVRHAYILTLERFDIIDGQLLIVMELADRNLWDRFKECRSQGLPGIPREELLTYLAETAEALDLMNQEYQLQHLDIKPQNLFLVHHHVKVADFGLVKDLEGMQASVTGGVTPVYAAPETFDGWVSRFCDQYSLAIVYQELLTGQRPFSGSNVRQLILQHLQAAPNLTPLPPSDQPVIARALSKTPDERFPNCREMARLLRQASRPSGTGVVVGRASAPGANGIATVRVGELTPPSHGDFGPVEGDGPPTASLRSRLPESHSGATQYVRALEAAEYQSIPADKERAAVPEVNGDGSLFPALVIGLGQLGTSVLQRLREDLRLRFGSPAQLPNLRMLVIDTDPEVVRTATRGVPGSTFAASDVVLAQLNRPSYYLKPREGRASFESWLNPRMLYRIPRSQVTAGVRSLGRLAFCDNYRGIRRRLQSELEACFEAGGLDAAARQSGLGLRSNRPRVYLVTSLTGGTGGGIFLDVAYTVRSLLRQFGYDQPDVVALLLVPGVDGSRTRTLTLGNAYAALTELQHFSTPGTVFTARYHEREAPLNDPDPPFGRYAVLPLPDETDEAATRELVDLAGQFLYRDLCTPFGRAADLARAGLSAPPWESRGLFFHTFGLYQLTWPRHALVQAAARKLCQRLVQKWMTKDSKPISEAVQGWVQEEWNSHELGADSFIEQLREGALRGQESSPEEMFQAVLGPLTDCSAPAPAGRRGSAPVPEIAPDEIASVLVQLQQLVGKPEDDQSSDEPAALVGALRAAAERLTSRWGQTLAELPVRLIEEPAFRLAGAEEALRQMAATIEQTLRHHEPLLKDLSAKSAEAFNRLTALATSSMSGVRRPPLPAADVLELLRCYPKWRYQHLMLQEVSRAFVSLRGHLSDELREVNFCRVRLGELLRLLEAPPSNKPAQTAGTGRGLFPAGCRDLDQAVDLFLADITPESLLDLDGRVQVMLKDQFQALVHVCMTNANLLKNVESAMVQTAEEFAASQLADTNAAEMFFEQFPDAEQAEEEVNDLFEKARPGLPAVPTQRASGINVLAVPPGPAGEAFRELAGRLLPELELQETVSADDILLYRERTHVRLSDLEQLGPVAQEAYRQMNAADNFTPHSRADVDFGAAPC